MDDRSLTFLEGSEEITGYRVKIMPKPAYQVTGYTLIVEPHQESKMVAQFVAELTADGRLEALKKASSAPAWVLGLGSWDEACQPGGMRYTVCLEENAQTDLSLLFEHYPLHTQAFEACEWMCFEIPRGEMGMEQFWKDDPYHMLQALDYRFHLRVGVHFDVYPPDYDARNNPSMEFWISVQKQDERCDVCPVREECGKIQPLS